MKGYSYIRVSLFHYIKKEGYHMIGKIHTLHIKEQGDKGFILEKDSREILLPYVLTDKELSVGEEVNVFIYLEKSGRTIASTTLPKMVIGAFGWAEVVEALPNLGVFVDIGTTTDVLVSLDELPVLTEVWPDVGDKLYVTLKVDRKNRLLAVPATEKELEEVYSFTPDLELNNEVKGTIIRVDREGAVMITDNAERGFIHHTERDIEPRFGQYVTGRVIEVKEDGTLNVSLLPLKHERISDDAQQILTFLESADGMIPYSDKSDPESIRDTFQMSKSAFKRALGHLMKAKKVEQQDGKTYLR